MSAILTKFIGSSILAIAGLIIVKNISGSDEKILTPKSTSLMALLMLLPAFTYNMEYSFFYTVFNYAMIIYVYKEILSISSIKSIISCGIMLISLFLIEIIAMIILAPITTVEYLRNTWYINILSNLVFSMVLILIFNIKKVKNKLIIFINKLSNKRASKIVIAIILTIVAMSTIAYILSNNFSINSIFTTNFLIFIIFFLLIIMLFGERNNYDKLSDEYGTLFNYVKIFEDWIENEQLNRHEFKNQLAVLRGMTKERKVKDRIDRIISENINIDNELVGQLRNLPSGGFKGLLYYKIALARNKKVNIEVDVSEGVSKGLNELGDKKLEDLSKLIGIYVDNAIEAALETKKKLVTIEIYSYDDIVNIVITNSFNKNNDISKRFEKGISSKGKGRGNGLYFSRKLLSKNKWIEEQQETINSFYIQKLI